METEQRRVFDFVTEHALVQRINRTLVWRAQRLIKSRGARDKREYGKAYILDLSTHSNPGGYDVIRGIRDLEAFGLELGCLDPFDIAWESSEVIAWMRSRVVASGGNPSWIPDEPVSVWSLTEVCKRTGMDSATIYRRVADGQFPKPCTLRAG
jgi:predicted DNA-binding transcriptional regulator AlpA